jgi:hypothetical protein
MALDRPVLHRLSCSNETIRKAPKHEFWVNVLGQMEWIGCVQCEKFRRDIV